MARSADVEKKRLAELKREVTERGFNRHASRLLNVSQLPSELRSPGLTELAEREAIRSIIFFPQQIQRGWHYVPKQALLFTPSRMIHSISSLWPDQPPKVTCIEADCLFSMKVTLLLLYGSLEIIAQGQDSSIRLDMEFNTVAWYLLSSPLRQFLWASHAQGGGAAAPNRAVDSPSVRHALKNLPIKFANGVKIYGLLPGEELEELVFQRGARKRRLPFSRQPALGDTLLLLTTHYMVVIGEDETVNQGWLLSYLPRSNIAHIHQQACGDRSEVSIQFCRDSQSVDYRLLLGSDALEDWRMRWTRRGGQWEMGFAHTKQGTNI